MNELALVDAAFVVGIPADHGMTRFADLYADLFPELCGYCRALLRDDGAGFDCAQEAFVRLLARWRGVDDPRGFLFLVATNIVRDEWRRQARDRRLATRLSRRRQLEAINVTDGGVLDLIARLPDRLRGVAVLTFVADRSLQDVADALNLPLGTVKRRVHESRDLLRMEWDRDE